MPRREGVRVSWRTPAPFFSVMAGLVPAIHVFLAARLMKTWMPGTRPGLTKASVLAVVKALP